MSALTLSERIEAAYDRAVEVEDHMQTLARQIELQEETAKMDNLEECTAAKNNDIRRAIILRALSEDEGYHVARSTYAVARNRYRLAHLEIERLRLLVEAAKVEGGRS